MSEVERRVGLEAECRAAKLGDDEAPPGAAARSAASTTDILTHVEWHLAERHPGARLRCPRAQVRGAQEPEAVIAVEVLDGDRTRHGRITALTTRGLTARRCAGSAPK